MGHPFDLEPAQLEAIDLDFAEQLSHEEAAQVGGGQSIDMNRNFTVPDTTKIKSINFTYLAEKVAEWIRLYEPQPIPIDPPITSKALGEEGGITDALCEDGGCASTDAIGEEGGDIPMWY